MILVLKHEPIRLRNFLFGRSFASHIRTEEHSQHLDGPRKKQYSVSHASMTACRWPPAHNFVHHSLGPKVTYNTTAHSWLNTHWTSFVATEMNKQIPSVRMLGYAMHTPYFSEASDSRICFVELADDVYGSGLDCMCIWVLVM